VRDALAHWREALDIIDGINTQSSLDGVLNSVHQAAVRHGCDGLVILGLPTRGRRYEDVVIGRRLPDEWAQLYVERNYLSADPIVRHLHYAVTPFEWTEAGIDLERSPRSAEVMHVRSEFGFHNGFVVPIPGAGGTAAGLFMGGERPEFPARIRPAIHMMGVYAVEKLSSLRTGSRSAQAMLTPREREVLTWSAAGKSAWEIGEILTISTRTVNEHAQTAIRKLGAGNRTHAVALALRDGLISV